MVSIRFGRFRFDFDTGALLAGEDGVDLGRRATALLRLLLARQGQVVAKADLIQAAWGGAAIEDSNLSVQIARLRRTLADQPPWIETVGRIGYRFRPEPLIASRPAGVGLSLLPFASLDSEASTFAHSLTDDVAIALTRFPTLDVILAGHAAPYQLHGSVRRSDGALRLAVRLTDAQGRMIWGERWGGQGRLSDRWVDTIAASVEFHVRSAEAARLLRAGDGETALSTMLQYYRHVPASRPQQNADEIALFDQALAQHPDDISIVAAACEARAHRIAMGWPALGDDDLAQCEELARRGLKLAANDAAAWARFGFGLYRGGDRDAALAMLRHAVEMNPNSITALIHHATSNMHWGRIDVAETQYRRALRLVPLSPDQTHVLGGLSRIRMIEGRFEEALSLAERALLFNPNYGGAHWTRIAANAHLGRREAARRHLATFQRQQPGVTIASVRSAQPTRGARMATTLEGLEAAGLPSGA
ncbi:MAG TPA: winged helix-turn-helix domain-containing protein [Bauldia sp.]|nr:winged helix-turn-helix domain-containing protein [Bauldia sp.]